MTSDFAPFVDVNLIDAIVMSTTPNNFSVKLVSSPVASEVGGFPLRSFWMVTWSASADVPPGVEQHLHRYRRREQLPVEVLQLGLPGQDGDQFLRVHRVRLGLGADRGGVIRRAGQVLRVYRDEVPERHCPEELRVSGAEVGAGLILPWAASDDGPDTSPLRADRAVRTMFGCANPPERSALKLTPGRVPSISANTPAFGSSPDARYGL